MLKRKKIIAPNSESLIEYAKMSIIGLISVMILILMCFLYNEFYKTIIQAKTVMVLKEEVALEDVEMQIFNATRDINNYKQTSILPENIKDPFYTGKIIKQNEDKEQ